MSRYFGAVMQNGYVVRDWREAARDWSERLGVGPFFVMEHIGFEQCFYRGAPSAIDMSVAIAYAGELQIELVQQHNDAPSIYRDFLADGFEGLQHVGALTADLDASLAADWACEACVQHGRTVLGQRFAYLDLAPRRGAMLELIEADEAMHKAFVAMRRAAAGWDGSEPIRIVTPGAAR